MDKKLKEISVYVYFGSNVNTRPNNWRVKFAGWLIRVSNIASFFYALQTW